MRFTETLAVADGVVLSLAGQGSACGWRLVMPDSGRVLVIPDASRGQAARTMVVVQWAPARGVVSPAVGALVGVSEIGEVEVGDSRALILEHPRQRLRITDLPRGPARVVVNAYAADAAVALGPDDDHVASIVTIHVELRYGREGPLAQPPGADGRRALAARLDEFGFLLVDETKAAELLGRHARAIESAGGIMEAFGTLDLGEEMIDAGALFPVWGMRPWVYRVAVVRADDVCPFGREVIPPVILRNATFAAGARVVPGAALRGRSQIEFSRWPVLDVGRGDALSVSAYVSGGLEPINPIVPVGVIPTFAIQRADVEDGPPNSEGYPLVQCNPIEVFDTQATLRESLLLENSDAGG